MTMWKFVPPNPNALTPATRAWPAGTSQSRSSVLTANGDRVQSRLGFGRSKLTLGGSTFSCRARAVLSIPAAPAAAFRCPMLDFTDPSATEPGASCAPEKASIRLLTSTTSPTRVEVPWPSIIVHSEGDRPALRQARSTARRWPTGLGAVIPLPLPSLARADPAHDRVDAIAVALGVGEPLEHEQRRALAHHEAVGAVRVRTRSARGQRSDRAELHERAGAHVAIDAADDRDVELVRDQAVDGGVHRRQRRRAGGVGW